MGDSLRFHTIFVLFGLTLPILVVWFEWLGIRKKDKNYTDTAKFWSKIMALLVITREISRYGCRTTDVSHLARDTEIWRRSYRSAIHV